MKQSKWQVWKYKNSYYIVSTKKRIWDCFIAYLRNMFMRYGGEAYLIYGSDDVEKCKDFLWSHYGVEGVVLKKIDKKGNFIIELEEEEVK